MWTLKYKGFYIHGYCDRDNVSVVFPDGQFGPFGSVRFGVFNTLLSAKRAITKSLRG